MKTGLNKSFLYRYRTCGNVFLKLSRHVTTTQYFIEFAYKSELCVYCKFCRVKNSTKNSKHIHASVEAVYHAFSNAAALEKWLAPADMTGKVHHFHWYEGGGYEMSLFYPEHENRFHGKTSLREDRYTSKIIELIPFKKIVQAIRFKTDDPAFAREMIMEVMLEKADAGTNVTFFFKNIPAGISPADNEEGTISTLEKLAYYAAAHDEIDEQSSDGSANAFDEK